MVAPHTDSDNCRGGVQRNSHAGADAALRSSGLAARREDLCVEEAMHLCVLAPRPHLARMVGPAPKNRNLERHELRRAMGKTQAKVAADLGVGQDSVARYEQRTDMLISTLSEFIHKVGGTLELTARLE